MKMQEALTTLLNDPTLHVTRAPLKEEKIELMIVSGYALLQRTTPGPMNSSVLTVDDMLADDWEVVQ